MKVWTYVRYDWNLLEDSKLRDVIDEVKVFAAWPTMEAAMKAAQEEHKGDYDSAAMEDDMNGPYKPLDFIIEGDNEKAVADEQYEYWEVYPIEVIEE